MPVWVLLRHELPDGSWHWDWLLEPGPAPADADRSPDARTLISFRVPSSVGIDWTPDQPTPQPISAIRLPEHRRLYLKFEGQLAGGQGRVERAACGELVELKVAHSIIHASLQGRGRIWRWACTQSVDPASSEAWQLCQSPDPHG